MRTHFFLLPAAVAMLAALSPTPARADFRREEAFQQLNFQNQLDEMPAIDADHPSRPLADVLSLATLNGQLVLHTKLPTTMGQPAKLKLGSSDDWSVVTITDGATGSDPIIPTTFFLNRNQFDPQSIDMLSVHEERGVLFVLTHEIRMAGDRKFVQLEMQYPNRALNTPGFCQLLIMNGLVGHTGPPVVWQSADFSRLLREHPVEADRYVRPMLHQVGQDAAMGPDPMLAFEVFSDQWTPGAATTAKITALIADLGSSDFHTRTHAEHELSDLGKDAAVVLMRVGRTKLDAEQNARIDKLLSPYQPVPAEDAEALRADPAFLLNCLYSDDPIIRKVSLEHLESATKLKLNFDPTADQATRDAAIPVVLKQLIDAKAIVEKP